MRMRPPRSAPRCPSAPTTAATPTTAPTASVRAIRMPASVRLMACLPIVRSKAASRSIPCRMPWRATAGRATRSRPVRPENISPAAEFGLESADRDLRTWARGREWGRLPGHPITALGPTRPGADAEDPPHARLDSRPEALPEEGQAGGRRGSRWRDVRRRPRGLRGRGDHCGRCRRRGGPAR